MEAGNDGFLPLALAAEHTSRVKLGPAVAIAFARSPMSMAYQSWDLAALSKGRFILGLGTQVKGHIERRYGVKWEPPVAKLRDYVAGALGRPNVGRRAARSSRLQANTTICR